MAENELKPCPFCGGTNLKAGAFSVSADCYIRCECGANIELEVPWGKMNVKEHDEACRQALEKAWNRRAEGGRE
jgi:hypothetical protein